jgi:Mg-chelatase subunit ChlD
MSDVACRRGTSRRPRTRGRAVLAAAVLAGFAAVCALAGAPGAAAAGACPGTSDSPAAIYGCLDLKPAPSDYVVLIDTSSSMQSSGLYPQVKQALPALLSSLASVSGSQVAVDTFDAGVDIVHPLGPVDDAQAVTASLPAKAQGGWTDFGSALDRAYRQLSGASGEVGGIILLSDGQLSAPPGSPWGAYGDSGWQDLNQEYTSLGKRIDINGYGIALTPNTDVSRVLDQVFPAPVTLSAGDGTVASVLTQADQAVQAAQASHVLQSDDAGRGVTGRFTAADGSTSGLSDIDFAAGHADVRLVLTSAAQHVPVTVSDFAFSVGGFAVQATASASSVLLAPGPAGAKTVSVSLTWKSPAGGGLLGSHAVERSELSVTATVSSPWSETITDEIGDKGFTVGGFTAPPVTLGGAASTGVDVPGLILLIVVVAAVLGLLLAGFLWMRNRPPMGGSVTVVGSDNRRLGTVDLAGRRVDIGEGQLPGMPGRATVRGVRSGSATDWIEITCTRNDTTSGPETRRLGPGDERLLRGLRFKYERIG